MARAAEERHLVVRRGRSLVPATEATQEWMLKLPEQEPIVISHWRERNLRHNALLFCLLQEVVDNDPQERWATREELRSDLKAATGLTYTKVNSITGREYIVERSMSFGSMDQDHFERWFNRAVWIISTRILNCAPRDLHDRIMSMVDRDGLLTRKDIR